MSVPVPVAHRVAADPQVAAVVGGGRMGSGIAHALLLAGARVVLVDSSVEAVAAAVARVYHSVAGSTARDLSLDPEAIRSRLTTSDSIDVIGDAALVVEAVPEILALKHDVLTRIDRAARDGALVGTNTSSIAIGTLAGGRRRPDRFLGMHFFNPVPASSLVEIVVGPATAEPAVAEAVEWVTALDKTPLVVQDSPGFASSRLGLVLGLEAIRMLEEGVASAADIDAAMTLGYKHPVGPLRLTDLNGLDIRLGIARYLHTTLGERFRPPRLLEELVEQGRLGRKTGRGFYDWPADTSR